MAKRLKSDDDEDVTSALTRVIGAIDVVKNVIPIQLGQGILTTTSAILVIVKDTIKNKEDFRELIDQCDWIRELIQRSNWGTDKDGMSPILSEALTDLSASVHSIHAQLSRQDGRRFYWRLFSSSVDKGRITDMTTKLDRSLRKFRTRLDMAVAEGVHRVEQELLKTRREHELIDREVVTLPDFPPAQRHLQAHAEGAAASSTNPSPLYRGYQPSTVNHFYTTNPGEFHNAVNRLGYNNEGIAGYIFQSLTTGTVPLYRLYHLAASNHFYTTSAPERDNAAWNLGYTDEGVAGFVYPDARDGGKPLYRMYSAGATDHFYTMSAEERDTAVSKYGFTDEGVAAYIHPA